MKRNYILLAILLVVAALFVSCEQDPIIVEVPAEYTVEKYVDLPEKHYVIAFDAGDGKGTFAPVQVVVEHKVEVDEAVIDLDNSVPVDFVATANLIKDAFSRAGYVLDSLKAEGSSDDYVYEYGQTEGGEVVSVGSEEVDASAFLPEENLTFKAVWEFDKDNKDMHSLEDMTIFAATDYDAAEGKYQFFYEDDNGDYVEITPVFKDYILDHWYKTETKAIVADPTVAYYFDNVEAESDAKIYVLLDSQADNLKWSVAAEAGYTFPETEGQSIETLGGFEYQVPDLSGILENISVLLSRKGYNQTVYYVATNLPDGTNFENTLGLGKSNTEYITSITNNAQAPFKTNYLADGTVWNYVVETNEDSAYEWFVPGLYDSVILNNYFGEELPQFWCSAEDASANNPGVSEYVLGHFEGGSWIDTEFVWTEDPDVPVEDRYVQGTHAYVMDSEKGVFLTVDRQNPAMDVKTILITTLDTYVAPVVPEA